MHLIFDFHVLPKIKNINRAQEGFVSTTTNISSKFVQDTVQMYFLHVNHFLKQTEIKYQLECVLGDIVYCLPATFIAIHGMKQACFTAGNETSHLS